MSSLTTSSTEIALSRSSAAAGSGDARRTPGVPGLRCANSVQASRREDRDLAGVVAHQVFGHRAREQPGHEFGRHVAMAVRQNLAGGRQQRLRGALFVAVGEGIGHGKVPAA